MFFASDNTSGVPDEVLHWMGRANAGYARGYGADTIMADVTARLREVFEAPQAEVHLVATGTAANALALASYCPPWATVFCHRVAHIEEDECGAPEFYTNGAKLVLIEGDHAKMRPEALAQAVARTGALGVHNVQRGMVSITNTTELGGVHSPAEVAALTEIARAADLPCHMDGARFANALVAAGCTPAEMTWKAGIDVLSFGGTKNGLMGVEAVILFDPARSWEFQLRRKRGGHLFSKHRYLSAQIAAYLEGDLWMRLAGDANRSAARLAAGLAQVPGARLLHPVDANMIFAKLPMPAHRRARAAGAEYYLIPAGQAEDGPDDARVTARLVASWSTTDAEVDGLLTALRGQESEAT